MSQMDYLGTTAGVLKLKLPGAGLLIDEAGAVLNSLT